MKDAVTLVIFEGGTVNSELEAVVHRIRRAVVIDQVIKAKKAGFEQIVLLTSYHDLAVALAGYNIEIEYQPQVTGEFHFGEKLLEIVKTRQLGKVLYMGGAAAPLISSQELTYIRDILAEYNQVVTANNYYSADIVGFSPGDILGQVDLPCVDNSLPAVLVQQAHLKYIPLQRSLGLQFDLDTPSDLLVLGVHPHIGYHTQKAITASNLDMARVDEILEVINNYQKELVVFGRVGSPLFKLLDELTHCRIRLYSEERGLKALGRDLRGEVKSLVAKMIAVVGYQEFFDFLSEMCDGAVLDTRIIFSHFNWNPSQSDRFYSDLGQVDKITHPQLRKFTQAAYQRSIPVILGGHSLVTGGLWAMVEAGLLQRELKFGDE